MTDWAEGYVDVDGVRLAVFEFDRQPADDDRPTVLLVHGWPDTHHVWTRVARLLADDARVVAYDTRGQGSSDSPLVNTRDFAVRTHLLRNTGRYATDLARHESPTPHWVPTTHPAHVADMVRDFVHRNDSRRSNESAPGANTSVR
ncbi:alpha/beta fold hydrolase [Gordonia sp. NPDC003425]